MTTTGRSSARLLAHQPLVAAAQCGLLCGLDLPGFTLVHSLLVHLRHNESEPPFGRLLVATCALQLTCPKGYSSLPTTTRSRSGRMTSKLRESLM